MQSMLSKGSFIEKPTLVLSCSPADVLAFPCTMVVQNEVPKHELIFFVELSWRVFTYSCLSEEMERYGVMPTGEERVGARHSS